LVAFLGVPASCQAIPDFLGFSPLAVSLSDRARSI
jgi:hypothetical protein